jgi:hypothetical protein
MTDKAFSAVLLSLLMMVGVAGWQFYSLAFGQSLSSQTASTQALPSLPMTLAIQPR